MQYLVSKLVKKETAKASLHRDHRGAQKREITAFKSLSFKKHGSLFRNHRHSDA